MLRPSLSTVCSHLPASSGSAKDLAARHGFHFRVTVVFRSVLLHRRTVSYTAVILPAAYSKSSNTPYALYTLYLFLVFAEYTPILLPILQRKHSLSVCQEQSPAPWLRWCLHVLLFWSPCAARSAYPIISLYFNDHPVFFQSPCRFLPITL